MKAIVISGLVVVVCLAAVQQQRKGEPPSSGDLRVAVNGVLDTLHDAAAKADAERYFACFDSVRQRAMARRASAGRASACPKSENEQSKTDSARIADLGAAPEAGTGLSGTFEPFQVPHETRGVHR
jgi:hypothetical protein